MKIPVLLNAPAIQFDDSPPDAPTSRFILDNVTDGITKLYRPREPSELLWPMEEHHAAPFAASSCAFLRSANTSRGDIDLAGDGIALPIPVAAPRLQGSM